MKTTNEELKLDECDGDDQYDNEYVYLFKC